MPHQICGITMNFIAISSYRNVWQKGDGTVVTIPTIVPLDRPIADILADHGVVLQAGETTWLIENGGAENDDWLVQLFEAEADSPREHQLTDEQLARHLLTA